MIPTTAEYEHDEKERALLAEAQQRDEKERALPRVAKLEARLAARDVRVAGRGGRVSRACAASCTRAHRWCGLRPTLRECASP